MSKKGRESALGGSIVHPFEQFDLFAIKEKSRTCNIIYCVKSLV